MIHINDQVINREGLADYFRKHLHQRGIVVCPSRKFIYMKGAKTAGTSILRGVLEKQIDEIIHQKDHPQEFNNWLRDVTDDELADYFIFSVVRNPWDRVVSITNYLKIPLSDFLDRFTEYTQQEHIRSHSLPLSLYTHNKQARFVDVICRFETLQSDMNLIMDKIGLPRQQLPIMMASKHHNYWEYYQEREQNQVAEIYKDDIQNYGYMFQKQEQGRFGKLLGKIGLTP